MITLREVIENAGYDIDTIEDARWLLSKQAEFNQLIENAEELVEEEDDN